VAAATPPEPEPAPTGDVRWSGRPGLARTVRAVVYVGPLLASLLVTGVLTRVFAAPRGTGQRIGWWVGLLLVATGTVWAADRALRRLMPLAALLEMSVLVPGRAPSRFAIARQTGSTRQLEELIAKARESDEDTEPVVAASRILALVGALRTHDRATRGHSERVRVLTDMVAEEMGLSQIERDRLRWAALLHDIGKLEVPSRIPNKSGRPTEREWERLKGHPAAGQELASPLLEWLGASAPVIVQHHERWDGLGYPNGLAGEQICVGARIVAVADAFEVMTAARPYKKAMTRASALREMARLSGAQFDPTAVRALLNVSAPRLRGAIGPWAWVAQIPVLGTAPTVAGAVTSAAGQTAAGVGAVTLGSAVGIASLPAGSPLDELPQRVFHFGPTAAVASPAPSPSRAPSPSPHAVAQQPVPARPSPTQVSVPSGVRTAASPVAAVPVRTALTTTSRSPSPSPSPSPTKRGGKPDPSATPGARITATQSPTPSPSAVVTSKPKPRRALR
jgi:hypothetical protein